MSELEKTIDLLEEMDDDQLQAIQTIAKILIFKRPGDQPIKKLKEEELWSRIDHSIDQADKGEVLTLEETMASIDKEFGL